MCLRKPTLHYASKNRRRNADLMPWAYCLLILALILIMAGVHSCAVKDQQAAKEEAQISILAEAQRVEVMDRILAGKVEADWRSAR